MKPTGINKLFGVRISHSYFQKGACTCLAFKPTASTLELLKTYTFKINNLSNGFDFYCNNVKTLSIYLNAITRSTGISSFDFDLESEDDNFYNYTDLPVDKLMQLDFSTSMAGNKNTGQTIELNPGLAEVSCMSGVGKLKVFFVDLLHFITPTTTPVFSISLAARNTQWQYYVVPKSITNAQNLQIQSKSEIEFDGPVNAITPNGEKAVLFTTGSTFLPLSEKSVYRFDLVQTVNKNPGKILFKGLPVPDPKRIQIATQGESRQIFSPMYVYI
ncbi:MAG TPA: hypothetical protein VD905_09010 [Flavobacteriales bacterium]|nr:hypothetical protein [Flavobacteriales bacterium]